LFHLEVSGTEKQKNQNAPINMHTKSYSEHLREAQYCGLQWRILKLNPLCDERTAETLPHFRIIRSRCNSKACPRCQLQYFRKIRKAVRIATITDKWRMFTITGIHHQGDEVNDLLRLETHFRELRKKLKRNYPNFKYFAVKELSPDGNWHYHGLWNIYIPLKELSAIWLEISGAWRCWLAPVKKPRSAVNYIFKYCFKSINNETERRTLYETDKRKFSSSRGLLTSSKNKNPYIADYGTTYSREELQQELVNIVKHSDFSIDDFYSMDYPYFEDMMLELFEFVFNEHPPPTQINLPFDCYATA